MNRKVVVAAALIGGAAIAFAYSVHAQRPANPGTPAANAGAKDDREAIMKGAHAFADAFNKHDAKAIAALWTENAEYREPNGETLVGRDAIEKAYDEFFKLNPSLKIEVLVKTVRFPAKDMAVEEGLVRQSLGPKDLPLSTAYVAVHSREDGSWKIALSSAEAGAPDRIEDLEWLLGEWKTKIKDDEVKFSFVRDPKKPVITAKFTRTPAGKDPISGSIRIAFDPEMGQIRSWGFEDDGAHSQSLWSCDGKSWILDSHGVLADGTPTAERIILQRVGPDVITWRAIDRMLGDDMLGDAPPMRLTRVTPSK